jgi:hypothetical protein
VAEIEAAFASSSKTIADTQEPETDIIGFAIA